MHRFWHRHISPILETVQPRGLLQIGAECDAMTSHILSYCRAAVAHVDIIEQEPSPRFAELRASHSADEHTYHGLRARDAIARIEPAEIAFIDGDRNWHTVLNLLSLIFARAAERNAHAPIALVSASAWPYGRRDTYRDPATLGVIDRHPYAYRGVLPGRSELDEQGVNGHRANALHEGGPRNGVMTAVEDFIGSSTTKIHLYPIPYFNGLAILVPQARMSAPLQTVIDGFFTAEAVLDTLIAIQEQSVRAQIERSQAQAQLARRSDALKRARALLAEQAGEIARLRAKR